MKFSKLAKFFLGLSLLGLLFFQNCSPAPLQGYGPESESVSSSSLKTLSIVLQPESRSVTLGSRVTFEISALGEEPLLYQWKKNGVNLSGANSPTLILESVQMADAGNYTATVANSESVLTSEVASLVVTSEAVAPTVTHSPSSLSLTAGANATFVVSATGTAPLSFQWMKNNVDIQGAVSSSFVIYNVQSSHSGAYTVRVSNAKGSQVSAAASLSVSSTPTPPNITVQPTSLSVVLGSAIQLSVSAIGSGTLSYQWKKNGNTLSVVDGVATNDSTIKIPNAVAAHAGSYSVVVTDTNGSTTSATATVNVSNPTQPTYDLVPLWESYHPTTKDYFYTLSFAESTFAETLGYTKKSVVAWLPCSGNSAVGPNGQPQPQRTNLGYVEGMPMNFTCAKPAQAEPFYRTYKSGDIGHFYTAFLDEAKGVITAGFTYEGVEGYIFSSQVSGTLPLFRFTKDGKHRYSLSSVTKDVLLNAGWTQEGIAGYAFDGFNNPAVPVVLTGVVNGISSSQSNPIFTSVQNVPPVKREVEISGSGRAASSGMVMSNSTQRPYGATQQRMIFDIYTGNLFEAGTNIDHIPIVLYSHSGLAKDGIIGHPYDGMGIFLARANWNNSNSTATGGQIHVELYQMNVYNEPAFLPSAMAANTWYRITVTATDGGTLSYSVVNQGTGQTLGTFQKNYAYKYSCPNIQTAGNLTVETAYCNNTWSYDRYPNHRTGYAVVPILGNSGNATGKIKNITVQWLNSSGVVLSEF